MSTTTVVLVVLTAAGFPLLLLLRGYLSEDGALMLVDPALGGNAACEPATTATWQEPKPAISQDRSPPDDK
jgi:hypothetical protein